MSIFDKVLRFIQRPENGDFESLALEVFNYQFENVKPYQEYCRRMGRTLPVARKISEIPPVSTIAFKYAGLESGKEPVTPAARLFLTSGTSIGRESRGRHLVLRPEIYRTSALRNLSAMLFPEGRRVAMLALHPTAERMPESSLSQMLTWCIEEFGEVSLCAASRDRIDVSMAIGFLREQKGPVCILGTTASFAALFERLRADGIKLRLAPGSRMMDTGGAKGQLNPLTSTDVIKMSEELLGIEPSHVINEYGMTEMCSQLYDLTSFNSDVKDSEIRIKGVPPWLRATALDPVTMTPMQEGEVGQLSFFDLANVGSVSALLTEDIGVVDQGTVRIIGRAATAEPRGCALAIEQFSRA
jgi:hypothetical protein